MTMTCKVCRHPRRKEIEAALVVGEALRPIASRFSLTTTPLKTHQKHWTPIAAAKAAKAEAHERAIVDRLRDLQGETTAVLDAVRGDTDKVTPLEAIRELGRLYELEAKLTGALAPRKVEHTRKDLTRGEQVDELRKLEAEIVAECARLEAEQSKGMH